MEIKRGPKAQATSSESDREDFPTSNRHGNAAKITVIGMLTDYHAKYFAAELTKRCSADSLEKLAGVLVDAQVDLNPHQIEAALFAFKSPLSRGAILADEVGLGKTIEAGLVLSQKWAERKRRVLVITPANLRKQWHQELRDKFFLPCTILEAKSYNQSVRQGHVRPLERDEIVICSYQFARSKAADVSSVSWDLVVLDEAHRLRNVYKPTNVIANTLKSALKDAPKLLLTATPLQNSLLELYGLVSFVDERTFGDLRSFRDQFAMPNGSGSFAALQARIRPICQRTLRRQVLPYVRYTRRHPLVEHFTPSESEDRLYNLVSDYLCRDNLQALPASQRSLMTLVLRKLLASSTFAIAGALETVANRLKNRLKADEPPPDLAEELDKDFETLDETAEEWEDDADVVEPLTTEQRAAIRREIEELEEFRRLAVSITHNAKGLALLTALRTALAKAQELGAQQKAIIFTESRRTQDYLVRILADSPWRDGLVLFNGTNNDPSSRQIYAQWLERHQGTDLITGSRTADMRSALVDEFRERGQILIATEAGAEGINLQFCSLVVNYDLPWNPQRIEQRIGRCHRYGQKHDVVVVNFLNRTNEADQRVFRLLSEKFQLFEGVFGASDEVLGAIESGVDFEKRIAGIYQQCRTSDQINSAFDSLQHDMGTQINDAMTHTRQVLLENFDEEVQEKLKLSRDSSEAYLNRYEQMLMNLTRHELAEHADFPNGSSFQLHSCPFPGNIPLGLYELPRRSGEAHFYRMSHPLAEHVLQTAGSRELPTTELVFDYSSHPSNIAIIEQLVGKSGSLGLFQLSVESLSQVEDHLLWAGFDDDGNPLDDEQAQRLWSVPARCSPANEVREQGQLLEIAKQKQANVLRTISERNAKLFESEVEKLDGWAEDLKLGLEREIKELDRQIKESRRAATAALTLEEKLAGQKQIKALEAQRNTRRRSLFDAQDDIDRRRGELISEVEAKLQQKAALRTLFSVAWSVK